RDRGLHTVAGRLFNDGGQWGISGDVLRRIWAPFRRNLGLWGDDGLHIRIECAVLAEGNGSEWGDDDHARRVRTGYPRGIRGHDRGQVVDRFGVCALRMGSGSVSNWSTRQASGEA